MDIIDRAIELIPEQPDNITLIEDNARFFDKKTYEPESRFLDEAEEFLCNQYPESFLLVVIQKELKNRKWAYDDSFNIHPSDMSRKDIHEWEKDMHEMEYMAACLSHLDAIVTRKLKNKQKRKQEAWRKTIIQEIDFCFSVDTLAKIKYELKSKFRDGGTWKKEGGNYRYFIDEEEIIFEERKIYTYFKEREDYLNTNPEPLPPKHSKKLVDSFGLLVALGVYDFLKDEYPEIAENDKKFAELIGELLRFNTRNTKTIRTYVRDYRNYQHRISNVKKSTDKEKSVISDTSKKRIIATLAHFDLTHLAEKI